MKKIILKILIIVFVALVVRVGYFAIFGTNYKGLLSDCGNYSVGVVVENLERSRQFYDAIFNELKITLRNSDDLNPKYLVLEGYPRNIFSDESASTYYFPADSFSIGLYDSMPRIGPRAVVFLVQDRTMVDAFRTAGLKAGGTDNSKFAKLYTGNTGFCPDNLVPVYPEYYAASLLDLDGNELTAVNLGNPKCVSRGIFEPFYETILGFDKLFIRTLILITEK